MADSDSLKNALGFAVGTLTAEHMVSAGLSSPWSVAKFAKCDKDKQQVMQLFFEATAVSVAIAGITGVMLGGGSAFWWSIAGVLVISAYVGWEYKRAIHGKL